MTSDKKQTRKFRLRDIFFFRKYKVGNLCQLGQKTTDREIMEEEGSTLRLVNHKSAHKNAHIHNEKNGEPYLNPVRVLGWGKYFHLRNNRTRMDYFITALFENGRRQDMRNDNMSKAFELAAIKLAYPEMKGI